MAESPGQEGAAVPTRWRKADGEERPGAGWRTLALALPAWVVLGLFFLLPLALMLGVSGAQRGIYGGLRPVPDLAAYLRSGAFLSSYRQSLEALYLGIAWRSLWMAALTTALCLAIGFPAAYALALHAPRRRKALLLGLVVVPLWTSFLIRTYAWMFILRSEGLLNHLLLGAGLISRPLALLYTAPAVIAGLVYGELPFMILPLYAALERLDRTLLEAAADLGAGRAAVTRRVTVPLALPGIVAGVVLVFVPSLGQFVVSDLLGGAHTMLLGNLIQNQFAVARNQPFGAALAFELTAAVLLLLAAGARIAKRAAGTRPIDRAPGARLIDRASGARRHDGRGLP
jgi:spermidine/putrescine transport system permease protein